MLPSADVFAAKAGALGISEQDTIVIYDGLGMVSSPRVWWTFRLYGAEKVFILEGGIPKWRAEHRPIETGSVTPRPTRTFTARMNSQLVAALSTSIR
jgi:thiosulfate/3-mercaptopyruvate sulfurtransferase